MMPQEQQQGVDAGNDVLHGIFGQRHYWGWCWDVLPMVFLPFTGLCDDDV